MTETWRNARRLAAIPPRIDTAAVGTLRANRNEFFCGPLDLPSCQMVTVRIPDGNKVTLRRRKAG